MTSFTNWDNIKLVFTFVSFMMVIFLCYCKAKITHQRFRRNKFSYSDGVFDRIFCFNLFWMAGFVLFFIFSSLLFAFIRLFISFSPTLICFFARFCAIRFSVIFSPALFATIISRAKLRKWLNFFALRTSFCYDLLRHGFFLVKKLCLEPVAAHTAVGSSYINILNTGVK